MLALLITAIVAAEGPADDRLVRARALEAAFQTGAANALRRAVLAELDATARPDPALRSAAASAAYDIALAVFTEQGTSFAESDARSAVRRFADYALDPVRFPPQALAFFAAVRAALAREARPLRLACRQPGRVIVEGFEAGFCRDSLVVNLAPGDYRAWLERRGELSAPIAFVLPGADAAVLYLGDDAPVAAVRPASTTPPSEIDDRWRATDLIPFGVGQLARRRWLVGSLVALVELGLAGWLVAASASRGAASGAHDTAGVDYFALQQGLAGGLLGGALVGGVVEAILAGDP